MSSTSVREMTGTHINLAILLVSLAVGADAVPTPLGDSYDLHFPCKAHGISQSHIESRGGPADEVLLVGMRVYLRVGDTNNERGLTLLAALP